MVSINIYKLDVSDDLRKQAKPKRWNPTELNVLGRLEALRSHVDAEGEDTGIHFHFGRF